MIFLITRCFERMNRQALVKNRPALSDEEIYNRFYVNSGFSSEKVRKAWQEIGNILHVEPGRLRPNDQFNILVCLPKWLVNSLPVWTDIDDLAEKITQITRGHDSLKSININTVNDLVVYLSSNDL